MSRNLFHSMLFLIVPLPVLLALSSTPAIASRQDGDGLVSAAGGIVEPSYSTAAFTDPAGLTRLDDFKLTLQGGSNENSLGDPAFSGGLIYGKDFYGLGAGVTQSTAGSGATSMFYGMAVRAEGLNTSFGISGQTPLSPSGDSRFNGAIRTALTDKLAAAFEAFDFTHGPGAWGAGLSYQAYSGVKLLSDFTANKSFGDLEIQPGILVGTPDAALTVSYGFRADTSQPRLGYLSDGFAIGGGLNATRNVSIQIYYQQLMKYYAVVSVSI